MLKGRSRFHSNFFFAFGRFDIVCHCISRGGVQATLQWRDVIAETPSLPALADSYVKRLFSSLKISDDRSALGKCCERAGHITPSWARTGSALETIGSPS
jgi:hypothetical protein